jgi:heme exporter protein CcmD
MDIHEILNMGGYGFYVWPAYLITLFIFFINIVFIFIEKRHVKKILSKHYES